MKEQQGMALPATTEDDFERLLSKPHLDAARRIDEIAGRAERFFANGSFAAEIAIANTISELRALLTAEVMKPIMALMNTKIGFDTDRNPAKAQGVQPYSVDVVRECFIESVMRGFRTVGNEWNIIAGGWYGCQSGFNRKCRSYPGVTEFKENYDVPRMATSGEGAIVKCRATWKLGGVEDVVERELPIKVNKFMGSDGILGKAKRKLLKAAHDQMTGTDTPEGELDDVVMGPAPKQARATFTEKAAPEGNLKSATAAEMPSQSVPSESLPPASEPSASASDATDDPQGFVADFLVGRGVIFDDFLSWLKAENRFAVNYDNVDSFATLPRLVAEKLWNEPGQKALAKCVKIYGGEVAK